MEHKDYYQIMGLEKTATKEQIRQAYRKLARKYHPDVSKEPNAEHKFKEVGEAYEILKDPEKKAKYDQYGAYWKEPPPETRGQSYQSYQADNNSADFDDFLNRVFRQRYEAEQAQAYAQDSHAKLVISLEDSFHGAEKTLQLQRPVVNAQGFMEYKTQTIQVKIPRGIQDHQSIRLKGQGDNKGDLYIEIHIHAHPLFQLDKKDIFIKMPLSPWDAALGVSVTLPTLGGSVQLKVPPLSQNGKKMRLKGRGLPGNPPGDQFVIFEIVIPETMNPEAKAAYENLAKCYPSFNPGKSGASHGR